MTTLLLTGASRGVGRAAALAFASRGLALGLMGRPGTELDATRELCLEAKAPRVEIFGCDLADIAQIEPAAGAVQASLGIPDIIVHNAGVAHRERVEHTSIASWDEQLTVNLSAPFALTRAFLPAFRARGSGRIIFVGSISSTLGTPRLAAYCASKWGLVGFMKSLAEELTDTGVFTCALLPGSIDTRMLQGSGFPPRMTTEEVAKTLTFLALDAPHAHNGSVLEMFGV